LLLRSETGDGRRERLDGRSETGDGRRETSKILIQNCARKFLIQAREKCGTPY